MILLKKIVQKGANCTFDLWREGILFKHEKRLHLSYENPNYGHDSNIAQNRLILSIWTQNLTDNTLKSKESAAFSGFLEFLGN